MRIRQGQVLDTLWVLFETWPYLQNPPLKTYVLFHQKHVTSKVSTKLSSINFRYAFIYFHQPLHYILSNICRQDFVLSHLEIALFDKDLSIPFRRGKKDRISRWTVDSWCLLENNWREKKREHRCFTMGNSIHLFFRIKLVNIKTEILQLTLQIIINGLRAISAFRYLIARLWAERSQVRLYTLHVPCTLESNCLQRPFRVNELVMFLSMGWRFWLSGLR